MPRLVKPVLAVVLVGSATGAAKSDARMEALSAKIDAIKSPWLVRANNMAAPQPDPSSVQAAQTDDGTNVLVIDCHRSIDGSNFCICNDDITDGGESMAARETLEEKICRQCCVVYTSTMVVGSQISCAPGSCSVLY